MNNSSNSFAASSSNASLEWATALVVAEHRRTFSPKHDDATEEFVELTSDQQAERATSLLDAVGEALPFTKADAFVALGLNSHRLLQVSRPRLFRGGHRWCVVELHAVTLDYSLAWYFTDRRGDRVYRDGAGETGGAVVVDLKAPDMTELETFAHRFAGAFLRVEPLRVTF